MFGIHTITTTTTKLRAMAAVVLAVVSVVLFAAGPAHADTKSGGGPAQGCLIENNGKLETVAVGSKIGLFTCGSDGEWHFGWLINAISAQPKKIKPVTTTAIHHGVLQAARSYRR